MIGNLLTRLFSNGSRIESQSTMLALAQKQLSAGKTDEAAATFRKVLASDPGHIDALCALGAIVSEKGEAAEALELASRLSLLEPDNADHPMRAALFESQLGNHKAARALYVRAMDIRQRQFAKRVAAGGRPSPEELLLELQAHRLLSNLDLPGESYIEILTRMHRHLRPRTYFEIGVFKAQTLVLASPETVVIGIDPQPQISQTLGPRTRVHAETSDDYFSGHDLRAELGGLPVDMAFIDGMHNFEFALRDFINIERHATRDSVIFIHDCYPINRTTAERVRQTTFWSGDIWRLVLLLRKHRPDLEVRTIAANPTGLAMITHLDPQSRILHARLDALTAEYLEIDYAVLDEDKDRMLNLFPNDWDKIYPCLPPPFSAAAA